MSRILPISAVDFVWLSVFVSGSLAIRAEEQDEGAKAPQFPQSPTVWINSAPMTIEQLRGKGIFLWFFEESGNVARQYWPTIFEKANAVKGQPIVFIAVNSGRSAAEVREYVRTVDCSWPVIADVDRRFEKACGVNAINFEDNNYDAYYITADGKLHEGSWEKVDEAIALALKGASWKIDPLEIPASLKELWMRVEVGQIQGQSSALKKGLASPKSEVQQAAKKIQAVIQAEIAEQLALASETRDKGELWKAFETCRRTGDRYNGFDALTVLADLKKDLMKEPKIKEGMAALKTLETVQKGMTGNRPLSKKTKVQLEKVVADFPDSDLSHEANRLLEQAEKVKS